MEMVSNSRQNRFLHPVLDHLIEKKESIGSQMVHTKKEKIFIIPKLLSMPRIVAFVRAPTITRYLHVHVNIHASSSLNPSGF
jgi:hypothetical protein